jgi:hypothetical protein
MRPAAYFYTLAFASVPRCLKGLGEIVGDAKKIIAVFQISGVSVDSRFPFGLFSPKPSECL